MFDRQHQERALNICLLRDFLYQDRKDKIEEITKNLYPDRPFKTHE